MLQQNGGEGDLLDFKSTLNVGLFVVSVLSAGNQLLFTVLPSMGCWAIGLEHLITALFAFPLIVQFYGPPKTMQGFLAANYLWTALWAMLAVRFLLNKRPGNPHHPREIGQPAGGVFGNALLALGGAWLALPHCPGISVYLAGGFFAGRVQVAMVKARYRRIATHIRASRMEAEMTRDHVMNDQARGGW